MNLLEIWNAVDGVCLLRREGEIVQWVVHVLKSNLMTSFTDLCPEATIIQWAASLYIRVKLVILNLSVLWGDYLGTNARQG